MLLFALLACKPEECVHTTVEVTDDGAPVGDLGFTVAELAEAVGGTREHTGTGAEGEPLAFTLALTRTEAPARFLDGEWEGSTYDPDWFSPNQDYELSQVCLDTLELPVTVALAAPVAGLDLVTDGAVTASFATGVPGELAYTALVLELAPDTAGLPAAPAGATAFRLHVELLEDALAYVQADWRLASGSATVLVYAP